MTFGSFLAPLSPSGHPLQRRLATAGPAIGDWAARVVLRLVVGIGAVLAWCTPAFA